MSIKFCKFCAQLSCVKTLTHYIITITNGTKKILNPIKSYCYSLSIICIVLLLNSVSFNTQAQLLNSGAANGIISNQQVISDTMSKKQNKTDDRINIYYFFSHDTLRQNIDTQILFLHRSKILNTWMSDLGNTGTASQSLLFTHIATPSMQLGLPAIRHLLYHADSIKNYNTTRPYTDVHYSMGGKSEQIIYFLHTQNILPNWNISTQYRKISSPGFYKMQKSNHDNASVNTNYFSHNLRYRFNGTVAYNKLQQDENGGAKNPAILEENFIGDRRLLPVLFSSRSGNNSSVNNYYRDVNFSILQQYFFGKKDSIISRDSTNMQYVFTPIFSIKQHLYGSSDYYRYKDIFPDTSYYNFLYQGIAFKTRDSLFSKVYYSKIGNRFSLQGDIPIAKKIYMAEAGWGFEWEKIKYLMNSNNYFNNYIFATLQKPVLSSNDWLLYAHTQLYFTGNALGNFIIDFRSKKLFDKLKADIEIHFTQSLQNAPYLYNYTESNYFSNSSQVSKQSYTLAGLNYNNKRSNTKIALQYHMLGNYIYRDTTWQTNQYNGVIPILQAGLEQKINVKHFSLYVQTALQSIPKTSPIKLPVWIQRTIIAYENAIFKKKLLTATGIECRYNTPYQAPDYNPYFYGFLVQQQYTIANIPEFTYFFNIRIKRFRASLALDQIQQLFYRNQIQYKGYAAQSFNARLGLHWAFVN